MNTTADTHELLIRAIYRVGVQADVLFSFFSYGFGWSRLLKPTLFQVLAFTYLGAVAVFRACPRRCALVGLLRGPLLVGLLAGSFVGGVVCLGGHADTARSLEDCLAVTAASLAGLLLASRALASLPPCPPPPVRFTWSANRHLEVACLSPVFRP
uniref:TMEM135_C_rich domain-containing protein n=1 Tax=Mesocestoides corti TaxID=53468 RepID=A0A5K3FFE3_MESCO